MLPGPTGVSLLLTRRAGAVQAASPLSCRDWGPPSQKAFDELPSPSPTGKCKGVRYMAATGGFLSHKPNVPSHKSQTVGWLYGRPLFRRGRDWPLLAEPRPQGAKCPVAPPPRMTMTELGASVCAGQIFSPLLVGLLLHSAFLHLPVPPQLRGFLISAH